MRFVFADTGYFIVLLSQTDALHPRALKLVTVLAAKHTHLVTTEAVLIETLDGFARHQRRALVAAFMRELEGDPDITILPTTTARYRSGLDLFITRMDKTWSMTDCISFGVMRERKLKQALTANRHFMQAGFEALLL